MKEYSEHLITKDTIIVVFNEGPPISILKDNPNFLKIRGLIKNKKYDEVPNAVDRALNIQVSSKGKFAVCDGCIVIDGVELSDALSDKLLEFVDEGLDTEPLEKFWDNLTQNPSKASRNDLYEFIEANNFVITSDGCFIAYRRVGENFKDKHTGKWDNAPGITVRMPRENVDPNKHQTCSHGLHVAGWEYAHHGPMGGGRLIECKVNPRDVVAVPTDYDQQKMRVCEFQVIREVKDEYMEGLIYDDELYDEELDYEDIVNEETSFEVKPETLLEVVSTEVDLDSRWRLRIPGKAIRKLGVGVGGEVVAVKMGVGFIAIGDTDTDYLPAYRDEKIYTVDKDNSIRLSNSFLALAGLDGYESYTIEFDGKLLWIK